MRRLILVLCSTLAASSVGAQIVRPRYSLNDPVAFVSLGMAFQQSFQMTDGTTSTTWQFSNATPYVASLEKALSGGASLGLRASTAKIPLRYTSSGGASDADANVSQGFLTLHVASGSSFHSVLELSAGATMFSNFRAQAGGAKLPPNSPDYDFSFGFGYGFGYSFNPRFAIDVVQDVTTSLHQKTGLAAGDDSSIRLHSTRVVGRFGLGGRR